MKELSKDELEKKERKEKLMGEVGMLVLAIVCPPLFIAFMALVLIRS